MDCAVGSYAEPTLLGQSLPLKVPLFLQPCPYIFPLCYVADDRVCYFYLAPDFTGDFIIHYFAGRVKRRKQEKKGIRHLCYKETGFQGGVKVLLGN